MFGILFNKKFQTCC